MLRPFTGIFAALIIAVGVSHVAAADPGPPPDFGSPPSGQIPILYNDHHVYSKPDLLKQGRVLAALVKSGTLLIPLRSMFEQMGATVAYDSGTKTATVSKPGSEVKVTVGKPEVIVNGESRPLDVPPEMHHGVVLVPVRVISEGMGAYVQWVPDRRLVVVRYIPATPPPPPTPTASPTMPPASPVGPPPHVLMYESFVSGDYVISPKVYNEFSPGNSGDSTFAVRGGGEFALGSIPFMLEGSFERWQYPHNCAPAPGGFAPECYVTTIGGAGSTPVTTSTTLYDQDVDARFAVRVLRPRIYVGVGYLWLSNNYGYPNMKSWGFGGEKLADLDRNFSFFGSIWYYPNAQGTYTGAASYALAYDVLKYQIGLDYAIGTSPIFIEAGWMGDSWTNRENAPVNRSMNGPFAGVGFRVLYP